MTMTLIADAPVDLDAEGFMTDADQWNESIAAAIARDNGIPELTDRHWLVVRFMRDRYLETERLRRSARSARSRVCPSRSCTPSFLGAKPSSPPRSVASPSPKVASKKGSIR